MINLFWNRQTRLLCFLSAFRFPFFARLGLKISPTCHFCNFLGGGAVFSGLARQCKSSYLLLFYRKLQAFVSDYTTLENFAAKSKDCSFKIVGKPFFQSGFGLAVRKNSSFTFKISQVLRQYEEYDISHTLKRRWFLGQCSAKNGGENARFARLSVADLSGLFLAICFGVVISFLFFTLQYFKHTIYRYTPP